jgi:hypothetical protein
MINPIMKVDVYIINGAMSFFVACGCSRTIHSPARSSLTGQDDDMCRDIDEVVGTPCRGGTVPAGSCMDEQT